MKLFEFFFFQNFSLKTKRGLSPSFFPLLGVKPSQRAPASGKGMAHTSGVWDSVEAESAIPSCTQKWKETWKMGVPHTGQ